jgi:hypothetical protein
MQELMSAMFVESVSFMWKLTPVLIRDLIMDGIYDAEGAEYRESKASEMG